MQRWIIWQETRVRRGKRIGIHKDGHVDRGDIVEDFEYEIEELGLHSIDQC